jgi:hypothetical protein
VTKFKREVEDSSSDAGCKEECIDFVFFQELENADLVMTGNFNSKTHFLAIQATFSFKIWQKVLIKPKQMFLKILGMI